MDDSHVDEDERILNEVFKGDIYKLEKNDSKGSNNEKVIYMFLTRLRMISLLSM